MKQKSKLNLGILLALVFATFNLSTQAVMAAALNSLSAYGVDTIAGYSTILSTSKTFPGQDVVFTVKKPEGGVVKLNAKTDATGVAKVDLYDFHTRKAGAYSVSVAMPTQGMISGESDFTVYPDELSIDESSITAQSSVVKADGTDKAYVTVNLKDKYANPLPGHDINLISSRASDKIVKPSTGSLTDLNGSLTFTVSSTESGLSTLSAVDVTSGAVLNSRVQVAYLKGYTADAGGDMTPFIPVALAATAGPINHFEIADLPPTIKPNDNVSFSVTAKDQDGLTVENYTGTIHFSSEGANSSNVTLPEDYTFKAENLGTHLFSLGLKFTVAGNYKIIATDISNQLIKGELSVTVGTGGGGQQTQQQSGQKPTITAPTPGTYGQNVQTISGNAPAGMNIKVYDNDQEIGTTQAKQDGTFSFQTAQLTDGKHTVYVITSDQSNTVKGTSDKVDFTIDTTPPTVDELVLTPSTGIKPDDVVNVKVLSEDNLSQAAIIFNNDIVQLSPSLGITGSYVGSIKAPKDPGAYPVDVLLVDQLGNQATYTAQATITITAEGGSATVSTQETQQTQQTQEETQQTDMPPTQVFGVIAYGSDKKVTLVWEAASDDKMVKNYRIYYGTDAANLVSQANTKDASTTWYVPNLENGKEYYFALTAIDDAGQESSVRSEAVSGIPFSLESNNNVVKPVGPIGGNTIPDESLLKGSAMEGYTPPEMTKNGPELLWIIFSSGLLGGISRKLSKKNKK